jgi:hypothetical protein
MFPDSNPKFDQNIDSTLLMYSKWELNCFVRGVNFYVDYLCEFKFVFVAFYGMNQTYSMVSFDKKEIDQNISCHCPVGFGSISSPQVCKRL